MKNEGAKGAEGASMAQSGKPSRGQPPEDSGKELSRQGEWARTSGEGDCVAEALHRADETAEEWATGKRALRSPQRRGPSPGAGRIGASPCLPSGFCIRTSHARPFSLTGAQSTVAD